MSVHIKCNCAEGALRIASEMRPLLVRMAGIARSCVQKVVTLAVPLSAEGMYTRPTYLRRSTMLCLNHPSRSHGSLQLSA